MSDALVPSERLRFVERTVQSIEGGPPPHTVKILQQWFTLNAPAYMRGNEGEWRDVEVVKESA
jgi:hypothetical protein